MNHHPHISAQTATAGPMACLTGVLKAACLGKRAWVFGCMLILAGCSDSGDSGSSILEDTQAPGGPVNSEITAPVNQNSVNADTATTASTAVSIPPVTIVPIAVPMPPAPTAPTAATEPSIAIAPTTLIEQPATSASNTVTEPPVSNVPTTVTEPPVTNTPIAVTEPPAADAATSADAPIQIAAQADPSTGNDNSTNATTTVEERPAALITDEFAFVESPDELQRAWRSALVRLPQADGGISEATYLDLQQTPPDSVNGLLPAVVYLHGCNGFWNGTNRRIDWLASLGFAVVAPASTAREFYPQSCNVATAEAGLFRPTLQMRWADAKEAIRQLRNLPWIDQQKIFLYGFSEGGVTTATLETGDANLAVAGRVIEAWVCNAPWEEYRGLNATESEPVLSIVAANDPWYTASFFEGDCGSFISDTNGSQSEIINYPPWMDSHALFEAPEISEIIRNFLFSLLAQQSDDR